MLPVRPFDVDFVFFDLDDTLLDHRHAEALALADLREESDALRQIEPGIVSGTYRRVNEAVWEEYGAGRLGKVDAKRLRFERLFDVLGLAPPDGVAVGDRYLALYSRHWQLRPGAGNAYSTVAGRRPVGILTNGFVEIQRAKLDRFPELGRHSSATIISEEVGLMKPDPRLFEWASSRVGVRADRILYVGDSLRSDVEGGLSAGWNVAWIDGATDRAPEGAFCFSRWEELLDRL